VKVVVIFAHPDVDGGSVANKVIINKVREIGGVEVRDLYKMYPDFNIDIEAEQEVLTGADVIIFQYPFYWYGMPGMLKEWLDRVFVYGFAYGSTGDKLKGKEFLVSTTIGGAEEAYQESGYNRFTIDQILIPMEQTARLTGMKYNQPLISHGMVYIPDVYNKKAEVEAKAMDHAGRLVQFINGKLSG